MIIFSRRIYSLLLLILIFTSINLAVRSLIYRLTRDSVVFVLVFDILSISLFGISVVWMWKRTKTSNGINSYYPELFIKNPEPMWIYDVQSLRFLQVNDAAIAHYGFSREEYLSMTLKDIRPVGEHERLNRAINLLHGEYKKSEIWLHQKKNGQLIRVTISSNQLSYQERDCRLVVAHDITERENYEEELEAAYRSEKELRTELEKNVCLLNETLKEKEQLAEIIKKIHNIVMITDPMANIIWVNNAFTRETGYQLDEIKGKNVDLLHGPETNQETQAEIMSSLAVNDNKSFEILNYRKDGSIYWVELTISPIYDNNGEIKGYVSIQNIVTERKERERKIQEQHEALRKLAWLNSHELRRPVASIISLSNIVLDLNCNEDCREINLLIKKCAEDLDSSVREMNREINRTENI